jgi:hypothetical protein
MYYPFAAIDDDRVMRMEASIVPVSIQYDHAEDCIQYRDQVSKFLPGLILLRLNLY